MKIGTRSVLFGVHQFIWHPLTVGLAWRRLFNVWPSWRQWVCIAVHDLGYWGKPNIDGAEGRTHPEVGAAIAEYLLDGGYGDFTLYHSREYAKLHHARPSELCWADKYSVLCEPRWFYLLRARLSGEVAEFKANAPAAVRDLSDLKWLDWYRNKVWNLPEIKQISDAKQATFK